MAWYVYILRCGDGSLYTGSAADVEKRLHTHQSGKGAKYTRSHLPVTLVYTETLPDRPAALRREAAIKKLTRREKLALLAKVAQCAGEQEETNMRRQEREIPAEQAWEIVDGCSYGTVSMIDLEGAPYAVPVNLVREENRVYFHCAREGKKVLCMRQNPRVFVTCVAADAQVDEPRLTTHYASAMLRGVAEEVTDEPEKIHALRLLCQKLAPTNPYGQGDFKSCLGATAIWRITVDGVTGKANPVQKV